MCVIPPVFFLFLPPPPPPPTRPRPPCRHNPSVYEITRAHLCSGGSHLGSEEASAGNHLGSTRRALQPASPVLLLLPCVLTAAIYFQGSRDSDLAGGENRLRVRLGQLDSKETVSASTLALIFHSFDYSF